MSDDLITHYALRIAHLGKGGMISLEDLKTRDPTNELKWLIKQAQAYNQAAIDELYMRFRGMIINVINREEIRKKVGEEAENVAWEIFYNAIHSMNVDSVGNVEGFLKASVSHGMGKYLKKQYNPCVPFDPQDEKEQNLLVDEDVYETLIYSYAFASYLRDLPEQERKLMKLLYVDGLTIAEASKQLGKGYKATAKMKYKCLKQLKKYITEE